MLLIPFLFLLPLIFPVPLPSLFYSSFISLFSSLLSNLILDYTTLSLPSPFLTHRTSI